MLPVTSNCMRCPTTMSAAHISRRTSSELSGFKHTFSVLTDIGDLLSAPFSQVRNMPDLPVSTYSDDNEWSASGLAYCQARSSRLELELEALRDRCDAEVREKEIWRQQAQKLMQAWDESESRAQSLSHELARLGRNVTCALSKTAGTSSDNGDCDQLSAPRCCPQSDRMGSFRPCNHHDPDSNSKPDIELAQAKRQVRQAVPFSAAIAVSALSPVIAKGG
eukprot:SAG31_NODE_788_length_12088_cov_3.916090_8_plen_221_part_00